jgi:sec-independent protein translocase protein TatC
LVSAGVQLMVAEEEKLDLVEHLDELRRRIIRSLIYVAVGGVIGWVLYPWIYLILMAPLIGPIRAAGGNLQWGHITEGLLVRLTVSVAAGIAIALPGILYELWAFVAPGLTYGERTVAAPLLPAALALFAIGIATGYFITPRFVHWMLSGAFMAGDAVKLFRVGAQIGFMAKLYLAFGACFQLPIILIFLVKAGVVSPDFLASRWREAVLAILVISAIVTPTWDPVTLMILAVPMTLLYAGTIWFARLMERRSHEAEPAEAEANGREPDQG